MFGQMSNLGPVAVGVLAGFSAGLLVSGLIVASRTDLPQRPSPGLTSVPDTILIASPVTVTVTGSAPAPRTVTELVSPPPARTSTVSTVVTKTKTILPSVTTTTSPTGSPTTTLTHWERQ